MYNISIDCVGRTQQRYDKTTQRFRSNENNIIRMAISIEILLGEQQYLGQNNQRPYGL